MVRTQIELTEEQAAALRQIAANEGRSVEDVIRDSVEAYAASRWKDRKDAAMAVAGRFRSGVVDLAVNHDDYLAEDAGK